MAAGEDLSVPPKIGRPKNPNKPVKDASYWRKVRYGLDEAAYQALLAKQDGKCAICEEVKTLFVDHCHTTGDVRGLLCPSCNSAIGMLGENPAALTRAISYLSRESATSCNEKMR
jgi:hypothetical protein